MDRVYMCVSYVCVHASINNIYLQENKTSLKLNMMYNNIHLQDSKTSVK